MTGAWQAGVDNGPQVDGTGRTQIPAMWSVVQLGGLEPPTSCSTDRRSNQLSYNCILGDTRKGGRRTGRKLGATPCFGKAARGLVMAVPEPSGVCTKQKPGLAARAFLARKAARSGGRLE